MKLLLLLAQVLSCLTIIPWIIMAMFSPMFFDAPDSTKQLFPYIIVGLIVLYPFFIVFCIVFGVQFWRRRQIFRAFFISLLPAMLFGLGFIIIS